MSQFFSQLNEIISNFRTSFRETTDKIIEVTIQGKFQQVMDSASAKVGQMVRRMRRNFFVDLFLIASLCFMISQRSILLIRILFSLFILRLIITVALECFSFFRFVRKNRLIERMDYKSKDEDFKKLKFKDKIKELGYRIFNSYYVELLDEKKQSLHQIGSVLGVVKGNREIYEQCYEIGIVKIKEFAKLEGINFLMIFILYPLLGFAVKLFSI